MKITIPCIVVITSLCAFSFFSCEVGQLLQGGTKMCSDEIENGTPNSSEMRERDISLKYEIERNEYKIGDNVTIRYIVGNNSQQEIYLITEVDEPTFFSHIDEAWS